MEVLTFDRHDIKSIESGGGPRNIHAVLSRLASRGHDVTLYSAASGDGFEQDGVSVKRFSPTPSLNLNHALLACFAPFIALRQNPDIIYTNYALIPWPIISSRRVSLYQLVKGNDFDWSFKGRVMYVLDKLYRILDRPHTKIAVSDAVASDVSGGTVFIVPNGADTPEMDIETSKNPCIAFIGNLGERKNIEDVLSIADNLHEEHPDLHVDIAGTGKREETVKNWSNEREWATYWGYISEESKHKVFERSWIHILPSDREGMPLTVIEAGQHGTPSAVLDNPGLGLVQDGVNGIKASGVESLEEKMSTMLEQGPWDVQEQFTDYTWERTVDDIEAIFSYVNRS